MIKAQVVKDSVAKKSERLTTMVLTYPRFIHAEVMTHRNFSRNAASSRAIPTKRFRADVLENTAVPTEWGANNPGMGSKTPLNGLRADLAIGLWHTAAWVACGLHWALEKVGVHKEVANRILEPFFHITVVVTATESAWQAFLNLRDHSAATHTIQTLAKNIRYALDRSTPNVLLEGQWHLPFVDEGECEVLEHAFNHSVARCARVSYKSLNHPNKKSTLEEDAKLFYRLTSSTPAHASPLEHQAGFTKDRVLRAKYSGNFGPKSGWVQYRKTLNL